MVVTKCSFKVGLQSVIEHREQLKEQTQNTAVKQMVNSCSWLEACSWENQTKDQNFFLISEKTSYKFLLSGMYKTQVRNLFLSSVICETSGGSVVEVKFHLYASTVRNSEQCCHLQARNKQRVLRSIVLLLMAGSRRPSPQNTTVGDNSCHITETDSLNKQSMHY